MVRCSTTSAIGLTALSTSSRRPTTAAIAHRPRQAMNSAPHASPNIRHSTPAAIASAQVHMAPPAPEANPAPSVVPNHPPQHPRRGPAGRHRLSGLERIPARAQSSLEPHMRGHVRLIDGAGEEPGLGVDRLEERREEDRLIVAVPARLLERAPRGVDGLSVGDIAHVANFVAHELVERAHLARAVLLRAAVSELHRELAYPWGELAALTELTHHRERRPG